jgi:hypothetical protein
MTLQLASGSFILQKIAQRIQRLYALDYKMTLRRSLFKSHGTMENPALSVETPFLSLKHRTSASTALYHNEADQGVFLRETIRLSFNLL